jgi:hypothetical protein
VGLVLIMGRQSHQLLSLLLLISSFVVSVQVCRRVSRRVSFCLMGLEMLRVVVGVDNHPSSPLWLHFYTSSTPGYDLNTSSSSPHHRKDTSPEQHTCTPLHLSVSNQHSNRFIPHTRVYCLIPVYPHAHLTPLLLLC